MIWCSRSSICLSDFEAGVALDFVAEVSEQMLPPHEPNERFFRLLTATLDYMRTKQARLFLASHHVLLTVGDSPVRVSCPICGPPRSPRAPEGGSATIPCSSPDSCCAITSQTFRPAPGPKTRRSICRRFLIREMEEHVERRFLTPGMLEAL